MDTVTILRELWRRRVLVALLGLVAGAAGWAVVFHLSFPPQSRAYHVGMARARVLVDTPRSQVVEVAPEGSETLGMRANVLANLMVDGELKAQIAKRAGLSVNALIAGSALTGGAEAVAPLTPTSRTLTTSVVTNPDQAELPLINVDTQAPTPLAAARLADAAVAALEAYVNGKASAEGVKSDRRLRITGLGPAQARLSIRGPRKIMGLALALFLFVGACAAILAISSLARSWRAASAKEREPVVDAEFSPRLVHGTNAPERDVKPVVTRLRSRL